ncbi:Two component transcriptional regulator, winged helix family OS=Tsukamurella paurometabola (strain ATCC 8368 / DSM / CCUG 35730 / CIP 100753 / JCM 10117/ KCTC 9821 / NBRC 16120 / NCIMB 702349 / NCTC 13040) OX=521096 GN=Tpau_3553 PE=4 SV=1 [Tsukamurella paurometabola]|uniref:Two component transcriptional regulator, winged helix family n=1 Tax=Tsukamurella paurometabola (strain ATCC 8368 / DSM 20162 / CCUG 35730 / CIP 100753 / JCM 10117 / KCTC 9821 / NBRC 16120 / NCIMB 702349 / NCTC 13040) TaxID=521096 RepID=D5UXB3_TSUPD|nr:response regulator transcription factor [Tsukamurella paurometabola]ADG80132.1 two component transcriptional regulator, winged helix family [Tsukamurella paurometabola DSM 20162]SUP38532.1 Transcriptional regulatory protein CseB [Tsukamurella paurometabola]
MLKILHISDISDDTRIPRSGLRSLGFTVIHESTSLEHLGSFLPQAEAVIVECDTADAIEAVGRLRSLTDLPILGYADSRDDGTVCTVLAAGADDYLVTPLSPRQIDARIHAVARRSARGDGPPPGTVGTVISIPQSDTRIDLESRVVTRRGMRVRLSPTEARVLCTLATDRGIAHSRDELLCDIQSVGSHASRHRIVDSTIKSIRSKLDTAGWSHIRTVRGFGYILR